MKNIRSTHIHTPIDLIRQKTISIRIKLKMTGTIHLMIVFYQVGNLFYDIHSRTKLLWNCYGYLGV